MEQNKRCSTCKTTHPLSAFGRNRANPDGLHDRCRASRRTHVASRKNVPYHLTVAERLEFYSMPEPNSGCTLWLGPISSTGYGRMYQAGREIGAHCVAYEFAKGPLPEGMFVCHRCHLLSCVNPDHLYAGTHDDRMANRVARGNHMFGERHGRAKITEAEALFIKEAPGKQGDIAAKFGISQAGVWAIKAGVNWKFLQPQTGRLTTERQ